MCYYPAGCGSDAQRAAKPAGVRHVRRLRRRRLAARPRESEIVRACDREAKPLGLPFVSVPSWLFASLFLCLCI